MIELNGLTDMWEVFWDELWKVFCVYLFKGGKKVRCTNIDWFQIFNAQSFAMIIPEHYKLSTCCSLVDYYNGSYMVDT